jgi:hypothetical protein
MQMWQFADLRGRRLDTKLIRCCSAFVPAISALFSFHFFPLLFLNAYLHYFLAMFFLFFSLQYVDVERLCIIQFVEILFVSCIHLLVFMELCCSFQGCYCSENACIRLILCFARYFGLLQLARLTLYRSGLCKPQAFKWAASRVGIGTG